MGIFDAKFLTQFLIQFIQKLQLLYKLFKFFQDNGGSEIVAYIVEKMDTSRGTWQEVGQFPDCEAKVTKLTPNKNYLFRVKAVNLLGESKPLESDHEITAKNQFDIPDRPEAPEVTDWDENRIDIA